MVMELKLENEKLGRELVQSIHFLNVSGINGEFITIKQIDGLVRDIPWNEDDMVEPYFIEAVLDHALAHVPYWEEHEPADRLEKMKEARIAVKLSALKYLDGFEDGDRPNPISIYDMINNLIRPFFCGYLSALTGKIED